MSFFTGLGTYFIARGAGVLVDFLFNLAAGFSVKLLAFSLGFTIVSGLVGLGVQSVKRKRARVSTKKQASSTSSASTKPKPTATKSSDKGKKLCKMFSASIKKLMGMKSRTSKQDAALKAARAGAKKYCPA